MQKIKSKWKAQKRKEGLVASRHQSQRRVGADADEPKDRESGEDPEDNEENERTFGSSDGSLGGAANEKSGDETVDSDSEQSSEGEGQGRSRAPAKSTSSKRSNPPKSARNGPQKSLDEQPSLRDLQRMAYSRASLHTPKSYLLHKHRGNASSKGRGGRGGDRGRGSGAGSGSDSRGHGGVQQGRGRGQPDMGLRMKALLEKIKQDFT